MLSHTAYILRYPRECFTVCSAAFSDPHCRITLVAVILETTFFQDKFDVQLSNAKNTRVAVDDPQLHMIVFLQVAIISQALLFVTRSHCFFFIERPSNALISAFCVAQVISSIIAAYADWGFTKVHSISGGWIGIVWIWVSGSYYLAFSWFINNWNTTVIEHCLVHPSRPDQVCPESHYHQMHSRPCCSDHKNIARRGRHPHHASPISGCVYP
jgi:hypothetical protein